MAINWRQARVAVLGGGGFLGGHVVDLLRERGCDPVVPRTADGWDFRLLESAQKFFAEHRPQIVFNCAARQGGLDYQLSYPAEVFYDNMLMGLNSMHAAARGGVEKYVNAVASCSYPGYIDGVMREEDYWSGPLHESVVNYGFTKKSQVVQGSCYRRQYGFRSVHLVLAGLYGPRQHTEPGRSHALSALLQKFYDAKKQAKPEVVVWGTGRPIRQWLFARDAAEALILGAEKYDRPDPLNVGADEGISMRDLAELIREAAGYAGQIVYDTSRPDGAMVKVISNQRIREELGWRPKTSLRDGIAATLQWMAQQDRQRAPA